MSTAGNNARLQPFTNGYGAQKGMVEASVITLDNVKKMQYMLRKLNKGWVLRLAKMMDVNDAHIYNIVRNNIKGQEARANFLKHASQLYQELQNEQLQVLAHYNETMKEQSI